MTWFSHSTIRKHAAIFGYVSWNGALGCIPCMRLGFSAIEIMVVIVIIGRKQQELVDKFSETALFVPFLFQSTTHQCFQID